MDCAKALPCDPINVLIVLWLKHHEPPTHTYCLNSLRSVPCCRSMALGCVSSGAKLRGGRRR